MKTVKILLISSFVLSASFLAIYLGVKLYDHYVIDRISQLRTFNQQSVKLASTINDVWREGDFNKHWVNGKLRCPKLGNSSLINTEYTRCNSIYLQCYVQQFNQNNKNFQAKILFETLSSINVQIQSMANKSSLKFTMENNCHEAFLPSQNYGHALGKKNEKVLKWRFDLYSRNLFLDKFLVSNYEVNRWIDYEKLTLAKNESLLELALPVLNLNVDQMKKYCMDHKKQLVPAHIMDAATIYPRKTTGKKTVMTMLYPYPWTRNSKDVFVNKIKKGEKIKLTQKMCRRIYTKECAKKFQYIAYDTQSSSWIGIYQVLGGYTEYTPNILNKDMVLRLSTMEHASKSIHHALGKRGPWKKSIKKVGFRCMREVVLE